MTASPDTVRDIPVLRSSTGAPFGKRELQPTASNIYTNGVVGTLDMTHNVSTNIPGLTFDVPGPNNGMHFFAGFNKDNGCNPCGSGSITITSFDTGGASGSFDVVGFRVKTDFQTQKTTNDPTSTKHAVGTFNIKFSSCPAAGDIMQCSL